jgi:hypothetical protein
MGRKVTVGTTKFPSSDKNPSKQYPPKSAFQKGSSYCSICVGKRPHKSSAPRGRNQGSPRVKQKPFKLGEPLMWEELIPQLPTRMRELHAWYPRRQHYTINTP